MNNLLQQHILLNHSPQIGTDQSKWIYFQLNISYMPQQLQLYYMQKQTNYPSGPQFFGTSVKKSWFDEGDRCSPGPGAHNPQRLNKTNPPLWTSSKDQQRDTFLQKYHRQYPSPDRYKVVDNNKTHIEQPHYTIPANDPQQNPNKFNEGNSLDYRPQYNAPKHKYPDYTFGYYFQRDYSTAVPPPNSYNTKLIDRKSFNRTQRAFSVGERPLPYGEQGRYPSVSKYSIGGNMGGTKYSVGTSNRPKYIVGASPGKFYNISGQIKQNAKAKTMAVFIQVPISKDKAEFPSPNKYNPKYTNTTKSITRNIVNFKAKRSQIKDVAVENNPSAADYKNQKLIKNQTVSFTKQKRYSPQPADHPGVGTYNVEKPFEKTLGHMALKLKKLTQFINPAPSAYEPKQILTRPTSQRPINYNSDRTDFSKSITGTKVGPGVYEVRRKESLSYGKMGKGQKFARNKNYNPGPGSYEIQNGIGKLPKYCSGPKKLTVTGFSCIELTRQQRKKKELQLIQAKKQAKQLQQQKKLQFIEKQMSLKLKQ